MGDADEERAASDHWLRGDAVAFRPERTDCVSTGDTGAWALFEYRWDSRGLVLHVCEPATSPEWADQMDAPLVRRPGDRWFVGTGRLPGASHAKTACFVCFRKGRLVHGWCEPAFRGLGHYKRLRAWALERLSGVPVETVTRSAAVMRLCEEDGFHVAGRKGRFTIMRREAK